MSAEQTVVNAAIRILDKPRPWPLVHFNIAAGNGETGLPDRFVAYRGHGGFLEFKARGGTVSPKQEWWLGRLQACGMLAIVVREAHDVQLLLDAIDELEDGRDG